jgi:hypothetical protein
MNCKSNQNCIFLIVLRIELLETNDDIYISRELKEYYTRIEIGMSKQIQQEDSSDFIRLIEDLMKYLSLAHNPKLTKYQNLVGDAAICEKVFSFYKPLLFTCESYPDKKLLKQCALQFFFQFIHRNKKNQHHFLNNFEFLDLTISIFLYILFFV